MCFLRGVPWIDRLKTLILPVVPCVHDVLHTIAQAIYHLFLITKMIQSIDHIVITCNDINQTIDFYTKLGMKLSQFGKGRNALSFGNQKINLHVVGHEFEPKAQHPLPGSQDLCFVIGIPIQKAQKELQAHGIDIIEGPIQRTGARGQINSLYVRDPDGNLIEVR